MPTDRLGRPIRVGHRILYPTQVPREGIRLAEFVVREVHADRIYVEGGPLRMIKTTRNVVIVGRA